MPDIRFIATIALLSGAAGSALAQGNSQNVNFKVDPVNVIEFSGSPSLVVNSATAGSGPSTATAIVSWALTTNQNDSKLTGSINAAMPAGLTLRVELEPPAGAVSAGPQVLGTAAVDLVTGLTKKARNGLAVTYTLDATAAAGPVASSTRTVTYTITGGV